MNTYYYDKLNTLEQRTYREMYTCLMRCLPSINFSKLEYYGCDFNKVFRYLNFDHPELYFVDFVNFCVFQNPLKINIRFSYLFLKDEVNKISAIISQKSKSILSGIDSRAASVFDKETYIYNYLTQNIVYDAESLKCAPGSPESLYAHSITGVFLNGKAVCDGISKAFLFLCEKVGVSSILVTGELNSPKNRGQHAWNMVNIGGSYYHVDVTGDLKSSCDFPIPVYRYFNISDARMRRDHSWENIDIPICNSETYNYYFYNGLLCRNAQDIEQVAKRSLTNANARFSIRYDGYRSEVEHAIASVLSSFGGMYRQYEITELIGDGIYLILFK